jgi:hypothetical protein
VLTLVALTEFFHGLVEAQQLFGGFFGRDAGFHGGEHAAAFDVVLAAGALGLDAAGVIDQDAAHRAGGGAEEVGLVVPGDVCADEAHEGFVDEGGGLEGECAAAAGLAGHERASHAAEFVVDEGEEFFGVGVAAGGGLEQCGHLRRARVVRVPWGGSLFVQPCTSHGNMIQGVSNGRRGEGEGVFWDGGGGGKCEGAAVRRCESGEGKSDRATQRQRGGSCDLQLLAGLPRISHFRTAFLPMPDRGLELEHWLWLMSDEGAELRERTAGVTQPTPAQVTALRKRWSAGEVHAALQMVAGRAKAAAKFGERGNLMLADPEGVEMATGPGSGAWKAARFAKVAGGRMVGDVCCGIGGDAMAMSSAGLKVVPVDRDPLRAWMAGMNIGSEAGLVDLEQADAVEKLRAIKIEMVHLDPARRTSSGRVWRVEDLQPGPGAIARVVGAFPDAGIKLAPGVDYSALGELGVGEAEVEIISERGKLTQAMVWTGAMAGALDGVRTARRATLIGKSMTVTMAGAADGAVPVAPALGRFVYEVDDAIERAEVLTVACERSGMGMAHPALGLLTGDEPPEAIAARWADAMVWLRGFEMIEEMGWNERKVEQRLRQLGAGFVEVKTRDRVVNPDQLQPAWSRKQGVPMVVFVLRFGKSVRVLIARRVGDVVR